MTLWVCHTVRYNRVLAWFPIRCLKHYTHIHTLGYERHVVRDTCFRSQEQTVNHICIFSFSHDKSCKHTYTTCDTQVTEVADSQKTCRSRSNGGNCGIISKKKMLANKPHSLERKSQLIKTSIEKRHKLIQYEEFKLTLSQYTCLLSMMQIIHRKHFDLATPPLSNGKSLT